MGFYMYVLGIYVTDVMPVVSVCKPSLPWPQKSALATDARRCRLWRDLVETPASLRGNPGFETRSDTRYELGTGAGRRLGGGVTYT